MRARSMNSAARPAPTAVVVGLRVRQAALVALVMQGILFGLALVVALVRAGI